MVPDSAATADLTLLFSDAFEHHRQNRLTEAVRAYQAILAREPGHLGALLCLSSIMGQRGHGAAALPLGRRAVILAPGTAEIWNGLGNLLIFSTDPHPAADCFRKALLIAPDRADGHNNLGNILQKCDRLPDAAACFISALALAPDFSFAYNNLASSWQQVGQTEAADLLYRRVLRLSPQDPIAHINHGLFLTRIGRTDEAFPLLERAVDLAPGQGYFQRLLAETGRITPESRHCARMETLLAEPDPPPGRAIDLHFALGRIAHDAGRHEAAFGHFSKANALRRRTIRYDEAATLASLAQIESAFSAELLARLAGIGVASPLPVFVIGMPRSGTSLVEQILASHPEIFGAEEIADFRRLVDALEPVAGTHPFPARIDQIPAISLRELAYSYLAALSARAPLARRIIDKMPLNFLFLGLIHLVLPQAKIIHVTRDPLATCLSCYARYFVGSQPYSYDLGELGRYFRAHARVMAHWRRVLPPGVMITIPYAELTRDMEGTARRMLEHCGLAWDPACLRFDQTERIIATASNAQVRQRLYDGADRQWEPYRPMVGTLLEALGAEDITPASTIA